MAQCPCPPQLKQVSLLIFLRGGGGGGGCLNCFCRDGYFCTVRKIDNLGSLACCQNPLTCHCFDCVGSSTLDIHMGGTLIALISYPVP